MTPTRVPWRAISRERHVPAEREAAWAALLGVLGPEEGEPLSVEAPWRHVRRIRIDGVDRTEVAVVLRDDGPESHLAWAAGTTAEGPAADELLDRLAAEGEALLVAVAAAAGGRAGDG